jgi:hypothetical protein
MDLEKLGKLSREELLDVIEKLGQQYEISIDDMGEIKSIDFRTMPGRRPFHQGTQLLEDSIQIICRR